ncbi:hypothetical protein H4J45_09765 [Colwellia sp. BRX10-6]|uniref:hypothetical protein n=1 Tax=unclassified Colwellia TaxID=196834 RepID=UPI0015F6347E|nr:MULTISPECIES: hypothetical protein [unclassified Colwellia]MBA6383660.1 hypothetical protein [Colwellia sp. BRX10-9]MBA6394370.1 hypothetical protein [Colwellia sp. BRX10-6]
MTLTSQEIANQVLKYMKVEGKKEGVCEKSIEQMLKESCSIYQNDALDTESSPEWIAKVAIAAMKNKQEHEDIKGMINSSIAAMSNNSLSEDELYKAIGFIESVYSTPNDKIEEFEDEPSQIVSRYLKELLTKLNVSVYDNDQILVSEEMGNKLNELMNVD